MRFAAEEVDGARVSGRGRALDVSFGDDGAAIVSVVLTAPRGAVLPELGKHVQTRISEALVETLDVPPSRIDVRSRHSRGGSRLMPGRRAARRTALFLLYQWDLTGQPLTALYEEMSTPSAVSWPRRCRARRPSSTASSTPHPTRGLPTGWACSSATSSASASTSSSTLRSRSKWRSPEAVNLAKRYASDEAGKLVNGVLARVAREQVAS